MGLSARLGRARDAWAERMASVRVADLVDERSWADLLDALLLADVGVATADELVAEVRRRVGHEGLVAAGPGGENVVAVLKDVMVERLGGVDRSLAFSGSPSVWLLLSEVTGETSSSSPRKGVTSGSSSSASKSSSAQPP